MPADFGDPRLPDRFWSKARVAESGCWLWVAGVSNGYARYSSQSRTTSAHRVCYLALVGDVPDGLHLDHLCRQRSCVNPSHMEPVTIRENLLRGVGFPAINAAQTHCIRGHEYDDRNTRVRPMGGRGCRACARERMAHKRQLVRGAAA